MSRIRTVVLRGAVGVAGAALAATLVAEPAHADSRQVDSAPVTTTGALGAGAAPGGQVTRDQIMKRAQVWVDQAVPYSANGLVSPYSWWYDDATGGRYRQDCSGFVSMAWQLPSSETTYSLMPSGESDHDITTRISTAELQPGDILNSPEHVVIFDRWIDRDRGTFSYYQESSRSRPTNKNTDGNLYASTLASHPTSTYRALRYKKISDGPAPAATPAAEPTQASPAPTPEPARRKLARSTRPRGPHPIAVTSKNRLYAISRDGSGVHAWNTDTEDGGQIGGPAAEVYAGGAGLFAVNPGTRDIYKYNGGTAQGNWSRVGGPGRTFAVTGDHLYGLSPDGGGIYEWTHHGDEWKRIGDAATNIYAGGAGLFATNPQSGDLFKYNGGTGPKSWSRVGGPGRTFAVSGDHLYGLSSDGSGVWEWTGHGDQWKRIGDAATNIYAGGAGLFATNPQSGDLFKYNGGSGPKGWSRVGGPGRTFVVSNTHVYGLSPDGSEVFRWTGQGDKWSYIGALASNG
ncbi:hypothetical protein AB4212_08350 [Streptomyces sp. 2MCAF27]